MRHPLPVLLVVVILAAIPLLVPAAPALPLGTAERAVNFELVGHSPLLMRGMNAAPAMYENYIYVGSRTDGSPHHPFAGVLIVDVSDPEAPTVVGQIGPPEEGLPKSTSRELRVWPQQKLLMVLNFDCSALLHACASVADGVGSLQWNIKFYDLTDPTAPTLVGTYLPSRVPHEFFLWVDPARPAERALLFMTAPTSSANATTANLIVADISGARSGAFSEIVKWNGNPQIPATDRSVDDVRLHSIGVSTDGTRTYLAYLGGGFMVLDTSEVAAGVASPTVSLATDPLQRPRWGNPGAHSAVKIPGKPYVLMTDEVYGDLLDPVTGDPHGCPWGWVRIIDVGASANELAPQVVAHYTIPEATPEYCASAEGQDPLNTLQTSYSAHNPTLLGDLALVTWHSGGLQAIDLSDPTAPVQAGEYAPQPLPAVATEDPALSMGRAKVVMWSYPIIHDGLIYVVDLRNGLYVLRYTGPHAADVAAVSFLEGNSNLGDALLMPS